MTVKEPKSYTKTIIFFTGGQGNEKSMVPATFFRGTGMKLKNGGGGKGREKMGRR